MGVRGVEGGCLHLPVLMASPENPRWVRVECVRCHLRTGYGTNPYEAWEAWRDGDVIEPYDMFEGEW